MEFMENILKYFNFDKKKRMYCKYYASILALFDKATLAVIFRQLSAHPQIGKYLRIKFTVNFILCPVDKITARDAQ